MSHSSLHARLRTATAALAALMIMAVLVPASFAASPGKNGGGGNGTGSAPRAANAPLSYNFQGDGSNYGGAQTYGLTTYGGPTVCSWCFNTTSTAGGAVALFGVAQSTGSGVGVRGSGRLAGVEGYVGDPNVYPTSGEPASGVYGDAGGSNYGVYGSGTSYGTVGRGDTRGIWGYGATSGSVGVFGAAIAGGNGVEGNAGNGGIALYGNNTGNGSGFYGFSGGGPGGVMGSQVTEGARFYTRNSASYALVTGGLAGTYGNVYVTGRVTATGGCCSVQGMTDGTTREMNAVESTQALFSDQGVGRLVNGKAIISIDSLFAQTVDLSGDYHVSVTPYSFDTAGLGVGNLTATSFEVRELNKGTGNFKFSWRIEAPQKGHAGATVSSGAVYNVPAAKGAATGPTDPAKNK